MIQSCHKDRTVEKRFREIKSGLELDAPSTERTRISSKPRGLLHKEGLPRKEARTSWKARQRERGRLATKTTHKPPGDPGSISRRYQIIVLDISIFAIKSMRPKHCGGSVLLSIQ
jgi:hypothetical protein